MKNTATAIAVGCAVWLVGTLVQAQDDPESTATQTSEQSEELTATERRVRDAVSLLRRIESDVKLEALLAGAEGVLLVPGYGTAALIVGVEGGDGVLFARREGEWANPVFYSIRGASLGLQAGGAGGSLALILMNDKAMQKFAGESEFAISGAAGLTIVNWSGHIQGDIASPGDVVFWTDMQGLMASAAVGMTNLRWDADDTAAYYDTDTATPEQILSGNVTNPQAEALQHALEVPEPSQSTPRG